MNNQNIWNDIINELIADIKEILDNWASTPRIKFTKSELNRIQFLNHCVRVARWLRDNTNSIE